MKRLMLLLVLCGCLASVKATDYPYVIVCSKDGHETILASDGLSFKHVDGKLIASGSDGVAELAFNELDWMAFAQTASEVSSVTADFDGYVEIFSAEGCSLGGFPSLDEARKAIEASGIYMIKGKGKTAKFIIRK